MGSYDRYRMDNRSPEQFAEDIAKATRNERMIIERYARHIKLKYGREIEVVDNGCDNTGELLDRRKVTTKADFLVDGKPTEVKYNNKILNTFRLKVSQLNSYRKQNATILWVNGFDTDTPMAAIVTPEKLAEIERTRCQMPFFPWGGKLVYEIVKEEFEWFPLG